MAAGSPPVEQVLLEGEEKRYFGYAFIQELKGIASEPRGALAFLLLGLIFFFAFILPLLDPTDPNWSERGEKLLGLSWGHPFGTDELSRDLLARVAVSTRRTLLVGFTAVMIGMSIGISIGYIAGWAGGLIESLIMRAIDVMMSFPGLILAIVVSTILGTGLFSLAAAITVFNIPVAARLARAGVLRERERDYALAARTLGASGPRILFRHVAVNTVGAFAVQLPIAFVASVLAMAALNFLGIGIQLPDATLGTLLRLAQQYMQPAPHYVIVTAVVLATLMIGLNFLSDVLSERLDPVRRRSV